MSPRQSQEARDRIAVIRADIIAAEIMLVSLGVEAPTPTEALRAIISSSRKHYATCTKGPGDCVACGAVIYARCGLRAMGESGQ